MIRKTEPDPYAVLGVARNASETEIRAAYHALVAKYHPDKHQGNPLEGLAADKMAEINRAYELLSDAARRAAYDGGQAAWPSAAAAGQPFAAGPGSIPRTRIRWLQLVGLLLLLPLLIRFGAFGARLLARLFRAGMEVTQVTRGTPLAAVLVLLAVVLLAILLFRRRRSKRSGKQ